MHRKIGIQGRLLVFHQALPDPCSLKDQIVIILIVVREHPRAQSVCLFESLILYQLCQLLLLLFEGYLVLHLLLQLINET